MEVAKNNSYEDLVDVFTRMYFKRGIVKAKSGNDRLVKEIFTNNNLENFMINYFAEKLYNEAKK